VTEARVVVGDFRQKYNQVTPHSRPGFALPSLGMDKEQTKT